VDDVNFDGSSEEITNPIILKNPELEYSFADININININNPDIFFAIAVGMAK